MALRWTFKMELIVQTRNLTISDFTSTHRRTIQHKSSNSYQIPSLKVCRKILLTNKFSIQWKLNTKIRLKKSGYNVDLKYINNKSEKTKTGKRNIICFNPPFSKPVSTNVAKTFLQLVTKHSQELTSFTKFSTAIQLKSATAAWTICQKSSRYILKSHIETTWPKTKMQLQKKNRMSNGRELSS